MTDDDAGGSTAVVANLVLEPAADASW